MLYIYALPLLPHPTGAVVARVRMDKLNAQAYQHAFSAVFDEVKEEHPEFGVGKTLMGVITDWSDAQLKGLQAAVGDEVASRVVKGCKVCSNIIYYCITMYLYGAIN